jgi:periplasmic divalent cation tolerance protein
MDVRFVYMTAGSLEEARKIARELVEAKLAACVNLIDNMNSFYLWDGRLQDDREVVLIAKTTAARIADLTARVRAIHSYDCPCVVSLPVEGGNRAFLDWIAAEVGAV